MHNARRQELANHRGGTRQANRRLWRKRIQHKRDAGCAYRGRIKRLDVSVAAAPAFLAAMVLATRVTFAVADHFEAPRPRVGLHGHRVL